MIETLQITNCLKCKSSYEVECIDVAIPIGIEQSLKQNLSHLINRYFEEELIKDHVCTECQSQCSMHTRNIKKVPSILLIHLKRYGYDGSSVKTVTTVNADTELDLLENKYQLRAIIAHLGDTIDTGHYTCSIFDPSILCVFERHPGIKVSFNFISNF